MGNVADYTKIGVKELSEMQQKAFQVITQSTKDVVLLSPTGSGKTLAYLLPVLEKIDLTLYEVQAVVIAPNRELAIQSCDVMKHLTAALKGYACYGGRPAMDEHREIRKVCPQIVFATPGRLKDHLTKNNISAENIKFAIIDEFDKCLEMGFQEEMSAIFTKLPNIQQRILLSATDTDEIPRFVNINNVERLNYLVQAQVSNHIGIFTVKSDSKDKLDVLAQLLLTFGNESTIVFVNFRESVERICHFLLSKHFYVNAFHGGLDQKQREAALYKFTNGSVNILVSTDLASRGLDIPDVDNIVHYHLPEYEDSYIHRTGRTARWQKQGRAFFILGPTETLPAYVTSCTKEYKLVETKTYPQQPKMVTLYIGKGKKNKIGKIDIVGFLCKVCHLEISEIGHIDIKDYYAYVAIKRERLKQVICNSQGMKLKGIRTIFELAE